MTVSGRISATPSKLRFTLSPGLAEISLELPTSSSCRPAASTNWSRWRTGVRSSTNIWCRSNLLRSVGRGDPSLPLMMPLCTSAKTRTRVPSRRSVAEEIPLKQVIVDRPGRSGVSRTRNPSGRRRHSPLSVSDQSSRPSGMYLTGSHPSVFGPVFRNVQSSSAAFGRYGFAGWLLRRRIRHAEHEGGRQEQAEANVCACQSHPPVHPTPSQANGSTS